MTKKALKVGKILGVRITSTQIDEVLKSVSSDIKRRRKLLIVTPNPEIVLAANYDSTLLNILNKADIAIPDGVGLVAWYKFLTLPNPSDKFIRLITLFVQALGVEFSILFNRKWLYTGLVPIKGRELALSLINLAQENHLRVFLLGGENSEADRARVKLKESYPKLKIASFQGPMLNNEGNPLVKKDRLMQKMAIKLINKFSPDLLFAGMSMPRQEKWLYRYLPKVNATVGMTVGGTFKYLSGDAALPPKWFDENGLSWLWRLFTGDQTVKRVWRATCEFPVKVFLYKFNL